MNPEQKQERILEARRLQQKGHFDRLIQGRAPVDLFWDEVTLECGHKSLAMPRDSSELMTSCRECALAWIEHDETHS